MGAWMSKHPKLKWVLHKLTPASWSILPNVKWPANVKWMNITKPFPFKDNSVDAVYSSHTLEHLTYEEGAFVFSECFRVLKANGAIRIIVPDLFHLINGYLDNRKSSPQAAAKKLLADSLYFEIPLPRTFWGFVKFYFRRKNNHAFLYDEEALVYQLQTAGFTQITRRNYGDSDIENILEIDDPSRFEGSLCIEAIKPCREE
jgi:SAM-dependent methyltransferase